MRAHELGRLLEAMPGDPEVLIEIIDEDNKLVLDSSFSVDEVSFGPFCILRSTEATPISKEIN